MRESTKENIFLFSSFVLICIIGIIYYFVDLNNNAIKNEIIEGDTISVKLEEPDFFELPEVTPKPSQPEFVTLYIGKGKKDKINKIDIVGFLFKKGNLNKDEVGRIDVKDHYAFAAISRKKARQALNLIRNEKIKGVKTIIEEAK